MQEEFQKEVPILERTQEELDIELIKSIIKTKQALENSSKNYEYADGELIDYYLYQMKAEQAKLNYLLKKAKKNDLVIDMIQQIEIKKDQYENDIHAS